MKVTLLLDLDETVFLSSTRHRPRKRIHEAHQLSYAGSHIINYSEFHFDIINQTELKKLIETVYHNGDDVAVFTAGSWPKGLLELISTGCNLAPDAAEKFKNAVFLNPEHDYRVMRFDNKEIVRTMPKAHRLNALLPNMPEPFRSGYFTLLDNDPGHVESCDDFAYIDAVRATTDEEHKTFYTDVLIKMDQLRTAHEEHLNNQISSSSINPRHRFFGNNNAVKEIVMTQLLCNTKLFE